MRRMQRSIVETRLLTRSLKPNAPLVAIVGPEVVQEFMHHEDDPENPIRIGKARPPCFCEYLLCLPGGLNIDLTRGIDTFKREYSERKCLGKRITWLEQKLKTGAGLSLKQAVNGSDFFAGRGVLHRLGCDPSTNNPRTVMAFKFDGVIFMFDTRPQEAQDRNVYAGHKFEQYVTSRTMKGMPDTSGPVDSSESYVAVFRASFECGPRSLSCMYSTDMDCVGSDGRFIELKTEPENLIASQKLTMKYASWWLQCRLANINELVIGVKPISTKVDSLKSVRVDSLPGLFDGYRYWTRNDCLYSLHTKLSEIKDILDDARNPEGTVVTLELKSKESRLLAMRIEQPGTSKYAYMYDEIKQRLSRST